MAQHARRCPDVGDVWVDATMASAFASTPLARRARRGFDRRPGAEGAADDLAQGFGATDDEQPADSS